VVVVPEAGVSPRAVLCRCWGCMWVKVR
jgi:hypothetical protein